MFYLIYWDALIYIAPKSQKEKDTCATGNRNKNGTRNQQKNTFRDAV